MKAHSTFWKRAGVVLLGPLSLIPVGIILVMLFGSYTSEEIGHLQAIPMFLQGSTDWGGSLTFAIVMAAYITFGVSGSLYLTLRLAKVAPQGKFFADFARSLWFLKYHWVALFVLNVHTIDYDRRIDPNDFRNMFLLASCIYLLSIVLIIVLYRLRRLNLWHRLVLSPLFMVAWLLLGSDGTTAKAGQVLNAGVDPQWIPRSTRHRVMLEWHRLCDDVLGDVR